MCLQPDWPTLQSPAKDPFWLSRPTPLEVSGQLECDANLIDGRVGIPLHTRFLVTPNMETDSNTDSN